MARVITFSRKFPSYHPKKGEPTKFVEKLCMGFEQMNLPIYGISEIGIIPPYTYTKLTPKYHTIRAGNRWKVGDRFSPRVWGDNVNVKSGRKGPYHSDQIIIAPDIEIKKVWDFEMYSNDKHSYINIDGKEFHKENIEDFYMLMKNDGLDVEDFRLWFQLTPEYKKTKKFKGQIICWNEDIIY